MSIPVLNNDLQRLVFEKMDVPTLMKSRTVCNEWKNLIDQHLNSQFNTPSARSYVAKRFVKEHLELMAKNARGHDRLLEIFTRLFNTDGVKLLEENFSLTELISVVKLYQHESTKKLLLFNPKEELDQEQGVDQPVKEEVAMLVRKFLEIHFSEATDVMDSMDPEMIEDNIAMIIPVMSRKFSAEQLEEMIEIQSSPVMAQIKKIAKLFHDKILSKGMLEYQQAVQDA